MRKAEIPTNVMKHNGKIMRKLVVMNNPPTKNVFSEHFLLLWIVWLFFTMLNKLVPMLGALLVT